MAYKAPIWEDGKSPAISAENLNNLSQAAEGAQVLYGNSAPTSSTEGAVGQFYLVVVADSDGNYPLYQCVAIANGSYTWRDTRRIPDSITSMLGIPAPGTISSALNVLANIGNLHVWERVQSLSEPTYLINSGDISLELYGDWYYSDSLTVASDLSLSLDSPSAINFSSSNLPSGINTIAGKFIKKSGKTDVYFCPVDYKYSSSIVGDYGYVSGITNAKIVIGQPAGTTTDYLTSTDPNAYPKQSAEGGQDASYVLGDVESGSFYIGSFFAGSNSAVQYMVSDTPFVDESGSVGISNGTTVTFSNSLGDPGTESDAIAKVKALFAGKYVMRTNDPETDSSTMYYTLLPKNKVVYIPDDISVSVLTAITGSPNSMALSKYQPVTGHAAIPANTTITYLGQLGGGARIEVGSYVGTGTYGSSNPCSVSASFPIKRLSVFGEIYAGTGNYFPIYENSNSSSYSMHDILLTTSFASRRGIHKGASSYDLDYSFGKKSADGKTFSWYSTGGGASFQLNESGITYYYIAIG